MQDSGGLKSQEFDGAENQEDQKTQESAGGESEGRTQSKQVENEKAHERDGKGKRRQQRKKRITKFEPSIVFPCSRKPDGRDGEGGAGMTT